MTAFYLYDDAQARQFEPFALTRPTGELRAGAVLIRERWEAALGMACAGHLTSAHLANFREPWSQAPVLTGGRLEPGTIVVNSRALPPLAPLRQADVWRLDGRIAAVRIGQAVAVDRFADGGVTLDGLSLPTARLIDARGRWADDVWDLLRFLPELLAQDIAVLAPPTVPARPDGVTILGAHPVTIEEGARIEPYVIVDASNGPVLVRRGASVAAFTRLVGPLYVGQESQVLGGKVANSSIGEQCRVHGEMSTTIMLGHANKGHDGFIGHSILGRWVNLGASTVTSNLKNTYGSVQLWTPSGVRDTGLQFLGSFVGDHAKTAIGARLTTGCVIGAGANFVGEGLSPKVVVPFAWGSGNSVYDLGRFLLVAERVMSRRNVVLDDGGRRHLSDCFGARWTTDA